MLYIIIAVIIIIKANEVTINIFIISINVSYVNIITVIIIIRDTFYYYILDSIIIFIMFIIIKLAVII